MILLPTLKSIDDADVIVNSAAVPELGLPVCEGPSPQDDPPPPYFEAQTPSGSDSPATSDPPTTAVRPTNFLSLSRGSRSITGTYAIDARIRIPQALLPPLEPHETEGTRRNLSLHTTNGPINVDVFVYGDLNSKVSMLLESSSAPITARLHTPDPVRPPIRLIAHSSNGPITIHLPPSFCGPVTIRSRSPAVRVSERLAAEVTTFSEEEYARRCFVGDFSAWTEEEWAGDVLEVESAWGSVALGYADDADAGNFMGPFAFTYQDLNGTDALRKALGQVPHVSPPVLSADDLTKAFGRRPAFPHVASFTPPGAMPLPQAFGNLNFPHGPAFLPGMGALPPGMVHPALWMHGHGCGRGRGGGRGGLARGFGPGRHMHVHPLMARHNGMNLNAGAAFR
ncbi:hypothetical protein B0H17DRAFT_1063923 [Mycena rosella]|uniref:DUF7330 domain-containing protein n=1 Tax=Mycena rosella TaxID=1033263 RepID=A0AAD7GHF2_MYCRO|nr:hypothetical protein B0H17DRAFT_1063923 [Mycena rosella]